MVKVLQCIFFTLWKLGSQLISGLWLDSTDLHPHVDFFFPAMLFNLILDIPWCLLGKTKTHTPAREPPLWTRSAGYPTTGPWTTPIDPFYGPPQKRFKMINKDFSYWLSDR